MIDCMLCYHEHVIRKPSIEQLVSALHASWSRETCFEASEWSEDNPARGQCVASSLVVQEYLGGDLLRYEVSDTNGLEEKHYCNILTDGTILDTTGSQYKTPVTLRISPVGLKGFSSVREKRLADNETREKYTLLSIRVAGHLTEMN